MPASIDTSLVRIHTKASGVAGAGFLVSNRHILTCAHVIAQVLDLPDDTVESPSSLVSLDFPRLASHTLLTARVVFWCPVQEDGRGDIAGLELLDKPPEGAEATHFASSEQTWQHPYRAFGFPAGQDDGVWSSGRLLGRQGTDWMQLEDDKIPGFAVMAGFSGAPVWDEQLQGVVGMVVASSQLATTKTAFAIPSDVLIASWPQLAALMRPLVPRNPYKGLRAFTERDAHDFFGRDRLTDELVTAVSTALTREQHYSQHARLLAVVLGPSGSGKSSVVMAGLIPRLRAGAVLNSSDWVYLDPIIPGADPLEALTITLKPHFPDTSFKTLRQDLEGETSHGLYLLATQLVKGKEAKVVLLVDQFEEAFTLLANEVQRRYFFELLVTAATEPRSTLFVILTLRADFYDRPMRYPELYRLIDDHHVSVLPMETEDLRKVIKEPANLPDVQLTFENGLVDELLLDMQGQRAALPLLEFTLDQLVQRRNGHQLTLSAYHELGGLKGALSQHAEATYQGLPSEEHRQMAREVFLRLVSLGATERDAARRRAAHPEFERADPVQTQRMQETLETFIRSRLLTTTQVSNTTTIEVSHEALLREWKRLATWLREARNDILLQQSLTDDVTEWQRRGKPMDRLYRGTQLAEAQAWAERNVPSSDEEAFLQSSTDEQKHLEAAERSQQARELDLQRRATRRQRYVIGMMGVTAIVIVAALILTVIQQAQLLSALPVSVTNDHDSGPGSLREAIRNAHPGDAITFARNLKSPITLTSGELHITKNLAISGPDGSTLTIRGGKSGRIFDVSDGATVSISNLTITNGHVIYGKPQTGEIFGAGNYEREGGGILVGLNTMLTLTNVTIADNSAAYGGAIFNLGTLTLSHSMILRNTAYLGGGIANSGNLDFVGSTNSGNRAAETGGGIYNVGTLRVTSSTISGNGAETGGGIYNMGGFTLTTGTISSNTANGLGGGIVNTQGGSVANGRGATDIIYATIYNNKAKAGGGIVDDATKDVKNRQSTTPYINIEASILAGNSADSGPDMLGLASLNFVSLVQNISGTTFSIIPYNPAFLTGKLISGQAPRLGPLRNNGGSTQTHALLAGSPAIDQIPAYTPVESICGNVNTDIPSTDQRGVNRPQGASCDLGAYEFAG